MKNLALSSAFNRSAAITFAVVSWLLMRVPACAKQVGEALSDMSEIEQSDPGGYTLMIMCICLLFAVAGTLIGVTTWFMMKGKKKKAK